MKTSRRQWVVFRGVFLFICISVLVSTLLSAIDFLLPDNLHTITGSLDAVRFRVGRRGSDELWLTVDGELYELYSGNSDEQEIFEGLMDQYGVLYNYDPDYVGETVDAVLPGEPRCEVQVVSTRSRGVLVLGLSVDGTEHANFQAAHAAWKSHCMGSAITFPVVVVLILLGNRFFKSKKQE